MRPPHARQSAERDIDGDTGVQRLHRAQAVAPLHGPPHVVHHRPREPLGDLRQERLVVAQTQRHAPLKREDPLAIPDRGQHVVDQQRRAFRHSPAHARS